MAWGANAKVRQLDWAYPALRPPAGTDEGEQAAGALADRAQSTAGTVDLLGILSASQALSSETSLERLHARVTEVLASMTGATGVRLVLWDEERQDWLPPQAGTDGVGEPTAPLSVLRYLRRTREPLIVSDAATDDRFARDPYFSDGDRCSLLAMPILRRGALQAALLLENRLIRGAFTVARLGTGLIGVKDRVEALGGSIRLEIRPGAGTDLHMELPFPRGA